MGDRDNMVFSGCSITYGTASAVVTATGMDTEMGKIANLLDQEEETQTPLQLKLAKLGKYLGIMALVACAIIFVVGLINGIPVLEIFMTAVSLAVSAIPEGLPAIVTIVLSIGVQRMVKKNALIRRLPAVETLGSASVICSDKTGTLTQNRMTLTSAYVDGYLDPETISNNTDNIRKLLMYGTLCCDGSITFNGTEEIHIGDPTETAIVLAAHKDGMPKDDLNKQYPRLLEIPFDSNRKRMTTVNKIDGKNVVIVKGTFDVMEPLCVKGDLKTAKSITNSMSEKALRVLAIAYKEIDTVPESPSSEELENDLTFMGLVGMIDPPRPEAKNAVAVCRKAGIKPIMITGDHIVTASAIAKELGILLENDRAITGTELDAMSDRELDQQVEHIAVYLAVAEEYAGAHALLRDKYVPAAPIWVTESGDAGGGGDTWASTYLDVLRTLNELGSFATITDGVIFHNTLASSDYGFLRPGDFEPRPNYYAVLLWNTLMGNTVYHCQNHPMESVHLY